MATDVSQTPECLRMETKCDDKGNLVAANKGLQLSMEHLAVATPSKISGRNESTTSAGSTSTSTSSRANSSIDTPFTSRLATPVDEAYRPSWEKVDPNVKTAQLDVEADEIKVNLADGGERKAEVMGSISSFATASELAAYIESKTSASTVTDQAVEKRSSPKGLKAMTSKAKEKAKEITRGLRLGSSGSKPTIVPITLEVPVPAVPPNTPSSIAGDVAAEEGVDEAERQAEKEPDDNLPAVRDVERASELICESDSKEPDLTSPELGSDSADSHRPDHHESNAGIYNLPNEQIEVEQECHETGMTEDREALTIIQDVEKHGEASPETEEQVIEKDSSEQDPAQETTTVEHDITPSNDTPGSKWSLIAIVQVVFFVPWCALVGASILLFPDRLDRIGFGLGYYERPSKSTERFAYWATYGPQFVIIFIGFVALSCWMFPKAGILLMCATVSQFVNAWHGFVPDERTCLGEDVRNTVWAVWRGWGVFGAVAGECKLQLRREGEGFVVDGFEWKEDDEVEVEVSEEQDSETIEE